MGDEIKERFEKHLASNPNQNARHLKRNLEGLHRFAQEIIELLVNYQKPNYSIRCRSSVKKLLRRIWKKMIEPTRLRRFKARDHNWKVVGYRGRKK